MVDYELHGRVAVLTLNRPEARNAVNGDVAKGMEAAIDRLEEDDDAWVGVLTHYGPVFSAGADLKAINAGKAGELQTPRGGFAALERAKVLAERIIVNAPLAVRRSRELSLLLVDSDDETGFRMSGEAMIDLAQTEDFWEGPKAFIEKRDPVWQGK